MSTIKLYLYIHKIYARIRRNLIHEVKRMSSTLLELDQRIAERARFKQRSHDTHINVHLPQLKIIHLASSDNSVSSEHHSSQIDIVLIGSSAIERFKTTGQNTQLGQLHYPQIFNGGVGGDKIENVLYRVNLGLFRLLKPHNPKVIVLLIGTNNLRPNQALQQQHLDDYYLLLQAILRDFPIRTQILILGFSKRKDVNEQCTMQSNSAIKELVTKVNQEKMESQMQQQHRVRWMDSPEQIGWEHLEDDLHLNANGYQIWDAALYRMIQKLLITYDSG
ncbi:hypothetical protein I4U23_019989 [Adineta vaga]|nr:hypothetical protein I4U23_019989 [Adineta vaga]